MVSPPLSLSSMNKDELNEAARDMNFNWVNEEHMKVFEQVSKILLLLLSLSLYSFISYQNLTNQLLFFFYIKKCLLFLF